MSLSLLSAQPGAEKTYDDSHIVDDDINLSSGDIYPI